MDYANIETVLYSKRDFSIRASVSNVFKNYTAISGYRSKKDNMVRLQYRPSNSIIIGSKKANPNNIMLPMEEYYEFVSGLKKIYKAIKLEDMYILDTDGKLVLNKKLSNENTISFMAYGKSMVLRTDVIYLNDIDYEGISIVINQSIGFTLTYKELKKLHKLLKHIDISTYMLVSSVAGYQLKPEIYGDNEYVEDVDYIEKSDYSKQSESNNFDVLINSRKEKRRGVW